MGRERKTTIHVQGTPDRRFLAHEEEDFISLTDMVEHFEDCGALIELMAGRR